MAEQTEQANAEADKPASDPVRTWTFIVLVAAVLLLVWYLRADRVTPSTGQARVHSVVVPIAAEVSGVIIEVMVRNNQLVDAGQPLFQIDRRNYELALQAAEAQLEAARQSVGASAAAVDATSVAPVMLFTSCSMSSTTESPSFTCGVTVRVMPTFCRSMVWKGFCAPLLAPVFVKEPVMKGTCWPTVM